MHSSVHIQKRIALAQGALAIVRQLSNPGKGVPPYLNHRLAQGLLLPILTYGSEVLPPTKKMLDRMTVLWNKVLRWCTNLFSSTPTSVLSTEACLLPLSIALTRKRRLAALRIACSSPSISPIAARLAKRFPNHSTYRSPDSCRSLITNRRGCYSARSWFLPHSSKPGTTSHLPLDSLLHTIVFLRPSLKEKFPAITAAQPKDPTLPSVPPASSYATLRKSINLLALQEWAEIPTPSTYLPSFHTSPHPFMGLDRFTAGRLHQMRAGRSYLAAHPSWFSPPDHSIICPRCESAPEDMTHALLTCPQTAPLRDIHMPSVRSLSPDAPVWASIPLLAELSSYIHAARINYPPSNKRPRGWENPASASPEPSQLPSPFAAHASTPTASPWPSDSEGDLE